MNLPFILDVALGLIFVYLILSLLASEIQELIATVFQWRAEHLKKSIETLLGGNADNVEQARIIQLANQIYDNPLIKNINQEAKGFLVNIPRRFIWAIGSLYRSLKKPKQQLNQSQTVFGENKHSGPSYISADIFATTLMETLSMTTMVQTLTQSRLDKFKNERLAEIQEILLKLQEQTSGDENFANFFNIAYQEFAELQAEFEKNAWDFQEKKADLKTTINCMRESLDKYIENFELDVPKNELSAKAVRRLKFFKKDVFDDVQRAIVLGGLQPNITEVAQSIDKNTAVYQEIEAVVKDKDSETHQKIQDLVDNLPKSVIENIVVLAKRAKMRAKTTEEGINALRQEIENTFDNSMERAGGVYKRNAKGVAILIGFIIAVAANADAFHMINRLSKDSALRNTITQNAGEILAQNNSNSLVDLDTLKSQTDRVLTDISLPIGWNEVNLQQQISWKSENVLTVPPVMKLLTMIGGWIVSGIAISMGASFWFDLLGRVVNVRNAGKPPVSDSRNAVNNHENLPK